MNVPSIKLRECYSRDVRREEAGDRMRRRGQGPDIEGTSELAAHGRGCHAEIYSHASLVNNYTISVTTGSMPVAALPYTPSRCGHVRGIHQEHHSSSTAPLTVEGTKLHRSSLFPPYVPAAGAVHKRSSPTHTRPAPQLDDSTTSCSRRSLYRCALSKDCLARIFCCVECTDERVSYPRSFAAMPDLCSPVL